MILKYVDIVVKLVSQRQKCGRVKELGGEETISRFFALYAVRTQLVDMAMANRANAVRNINERYLILNDLAKSRVS